VTSVLVVHDSVVAQRLLVQELSKAADLQVVGTAANRRTAHDRIAALAPDVVILDVEMARMDGLGFLQELMEQRPTRAVVVSSLDGEGAERALRALALGAIEVAKRPSSQFSGPDELRGLTRAVRAAAAARLPASLPSRRVPSAPIALRTKELVLCLGASTGDVRALEEILMAIPADAPATVIVQQLPVDLTKAFAARLDSSCLMHVREAQDGDPVVPGTALLAPFGRHMLLAREDARIVVHLVEAPSSGDRTAIDALFDSVARHVGRAALGVVLTGAGEAGAVGLRALRAAGARTIAQDEVTGVAEGVPKVAIDRGAAELTLPLERIADAVLEWAAAPREVT
jgi:two-component system chemotaxis response regulator CheB